FTEVPVAKVQLSAALRLGRAHEALEGPGEGLALMVVPSARYYDGRSANKPWLHETPDPITQVVYDSWVEVAAETARRLGLAGGDVVRVVSPHGRVELPVYVSETLGAGVVAVPLGLGHSEYGRFAQAVGQSPLGLLPGEPDPVSGGPRWLA